MLITGDQLLAHAVGDYILQSDWMASEKTKKTTAAVAHVLTYFLPFLFLTRSLPALAFIIGTHFIIDRWRLARYVCWAKNFLAPRWITPAGTADDPMTLKGKAGKWHSGSDLSAGEIVILRNRAWAQCSATGYDPSKPAWMAVWLMIIVDNSMHIFCNGLALHLWP